MREEAEVHNRAGGWTITEPALTAAAEVIAQTLREYAGRLDLTDPAVSRLVAQRTLTAAAGASALTWAHDLPQGWPEHDHEFVPSGLYQSRVDPSVWLSQCLICRATGVAGRNPDTAARLQDPLPAGTDLSEAVDEFIFDTWLREGRS